MMLVKVYNEQQQYSLWPHPEFQTWKNRVYKRFQYSRTVGEPCDKL